MGLASMYLFLGLLLSVVLHGIDISLAAPGLFDDGAYDPSSDLSIFSGDEADLGAPTIEDPPDFTISLASNQEDLGPLASNDQFDWDTDDILPFLDDGGIDDTKFQQDSDLLAFTPSCAFDVPSTQGLDRKKRDPLPDICPSPDAQSRGQGNQPTRKPAKPRNPANPVRTDDFFDINDFYDSRDRDTLRGYIPSKTADSLCGAKKFTVCDTGDPYFRIPQILPSYALERCFICMFGSFVFVFFVLFFLGQP